MRRGSVSVRGNSLDLSEWEIKIGEFSPVSVNRECLVILAGRKERGNLLRSVLMLFEIFLESSDESNDGKIGLGIWKIQFLVSCFQSSKY